MSVRITEKPHDKLKAYKTLVIINLTMAIVTTILKIWVGNVGEELSAGEPTVGGPAVVAAAFWTLALIPTIIILQVVPAIITICQSLKLLGRETLNMQSPWLAVGVLGVVIEVFALVVL